MFETMCSTVSRCEKDLKLDTRDSGQSFVGMKQKKFTGNRCKQTITVAERCNRKVNSNKKAPSASIRFGRTSTNDKAETCVYNVLVRRRRC